MAFVPVPQPTSSARAGATARDSTISTSIGSGVPVSHGSGSPDAYLSSPGGRGITASSRRFAALTGGLAPLPPVLFIADVFQPVDRLALELLLHGDVRHRGRRRRAVPVF